MAEVRSWDVAVDRGLLDLRRVYADSRLDLLELLADLPSDEWRRPTMLPGWDVKAVVLHLLDNDNGRVASGWGSGSSQGAVAFDALAARIEASNDRWVADMGHISPPLLLDQLQHQGERAAQILDDADMWRPGLPVRWTGDGPSPLWLDVAREYTERWIHEQQIREAMRVPLTDDRQRLHPVLDALMLAMPRAYERIAAPAGTVVTIDASGVAGGTWQLTRGDGRWRVSPGANAPARARVALPADLWWRWLARLVPRAAIEPVLLTEGDERLWRPATKAVSVMTSSV